MIKYLLTHRHTELSFDPAIGWFLVENSALKEYMSKNPGIEFCFNHGHQSAIDNMVREESEEWLRAPSIGIGSGRLSPAQCDNRVADFIAKIADYHLLFPDEDSRLMFILSF